MINYRTGLTYLLTYNIIPYWITLDRIRPTSERNGPRRIWTKHLDLEMIAQDPQTFYSHLKNNNIRYNIGLLSVLSAFKLLL